ncbi:interferon-inducible GTPase 5-like isoform X2 [Lepisosteus oculatus]
MGSLLRSRVLTEVVAQVQSMLDQLDSATLDIAVTGESGAGKSTFVNAFRGLDDEHPDAAPTGVTETTREVTPYAHPRIPTVRLWDLPGIGTPCFQADSYLQAVGLRRFDLVIIVASERFRESHAALARAVRAHGGRVYLVRNKVDRDVGAGLRRRAGAGGEEALLARIREDCAGGLARCGLPGAPVFLVSCFQLQRYDFERLQDTLEAELDGLKRHALLLALPNLSAAALAAKRRALAGTLWRTAMSACLAAMAPGGAVRGSVPILVQALRSYQRHFGLDQDSLQQLAALTGKQYQELCAEVQSSAGRELSESSVGDMLSQVAVGQQLLAGLLESRVPVLGTITSGGVSFLACYWLLRSALSDLSEDAGRVMSKALEGSDPGTKDTQMDI